jgi:hypothetical protein
MYGANALIVDQKCRVGQVVSPGSQQRILPGTVSPLRVQGGVGTYVSAYEAAISTCTSVGVSHDQHITGLCKGMRYLSVIGETRKENTNVRLLGCGRNC